MDMIEKAAAKQAAKEKEKESLLERAASKASSDKPTAPEVTAAEAEAPAVEQRQRRSRYSEVDLEALRRGGYVTPDTVPNATVEEFRLIKRTLLITAFGKGREQGNENLVLVTSCNPSEGKTFCAINLALSMALEQDVTVLLVDADFGKPEVLTRLGIEGGKGLIDVLVDPETDLSDCLIRTNIPNLSVLPAGRQHNLTPELIASDRMGEMMSELARRYPDRIIIFDSPPALANSSASVMALHVGQALFVVEAERTTQPEIKESLSMLSACKKVHLLLNKTRFQSAERKFGAYYGYSGR